MSERKHSRTPVGAHFRRALTDREMARIHSLIQTRGASAGFTALWDILLLEAHDLTLNQAAETGLDYDVRDYAITHDQAADIFRAMVATAAGKRLLLQSLGRMWLDQGPASFDPAPTAREHHHTAEAAFLAFVDEPTPQNAHAAEVAIATLQRRYDAVLRRLDGVEEPPEPACTHDPTATPVDCLYATLFELAGAHLEDRAATLAHGLAAVRELQRRLNYADAHSVDDLRRRVELLEDQLEVARTRR